MDMRFFVDFNSIVSRCVFLIVCLSASKQEKAPFRTELTGNDDFMLLELFDSKKKQIQSVNTVICLVF
jgi:hypothetical protein